MTQQPKPTLMSNPGPGHKWGYYPSGSGRYGLYRIMEGIRWPIALVTFPPLGVEHDTVIMDMIVAGLNANDN